VIFLRLSMYIQGKYHEMDYEHHLSPVITILIECLEYLTISFQLYQLSIVEW